MAGALVLFLLVLGLVAALPFRAGRVIRPAFELPTVAGERTGCAGQAGGKPTGPVGSEVQALRSKLSEHEPAAAPGRVSTKILTREVEFYQLVLGLTRVPGPRILVRVTEGRRPGGVLAPTAQASDLSGIVGELWAAGAEAVAVNGHRIPAATGFSVDAEGITAGVFRLRPPSEIQAIRNTDGCGTLTAFAAASWTDCSRWA